MFASSNKTLPQNIANYIHQYQTEAIKNLRSLSLNKLLMTKPDLFFYVQRRPVGELIEQLLDGYLFKIKKDAFGNLPNDLKVSTEKQSEEALNSIYENIFEILIGQGGYAKDLCETKAGACNLFTLEFINRFCDKKGLIIWPKLVEFFNRNEVSLSNN